MAKSLAPGAGESLSEDLIYNILLRLPVKIILRCKAVSKSWKTLISTPDFVKSHLTVGRPCADETLVNFNSMYVKFLNVNSNEIVANLRLPKIISEFQYVTKAYLVGSACGILCLCGVVSWYSNYPYMPHHVADLPIKLTYLWNPATKQSIRIPPPTIDVESKHWIIGFGFDHVSNDFKILRIVMSHFSAQVYSTNRKCWQKVEQVVHNSVDLHGRSGIFVCVKGYLCCIRNSNMIAFDLNNEVLNCAIELPAGGSIDARITEFNDSIAVVKWVDITDLKVNVKLWKLDNETSCISVGGVEASWSLMLSIDHSRSCVFFYFNKGDFLPSLGGDDSWCFCKSDNNKKRDLWNKIQNFQICGESVFGPIQIFKYAESLFSFA